MFFILAFFHFLCKVIILTSLLSVNKNWIFKIFKWKYLVDNSFTCSFVLFECKFCNKTFTMIYLNDFFCAIFSFHSHEIFYFDPCWHTNSCRRMLSVLNGKAIEVVTEWVYLGVTLKSDKIFNCSVTDRIRKFYHCANAIFRIDGRSNDTVMQNLIEIHCVPLLTYDTMKIIVTLEFRQEQKNHHVFYQKQIIHLIIYDTLGS